MIGIGSKFQSPKLKDEQGYQIQFDSEAALNKALAARYARPGLSGFGRWKARGRHWFKKKLKKDKLNTLAQEQDIILNAGAVSKAQGNLRFVSYGIQGASAAAKFGAKAAGTAIAGPAGIVVGLALAFAIDKVEKAATARLRDELDTRGRLAYAVLGSDKDRGIIEDSAPAGFGGFIDESLEIKDEEKRTAIVKSVHKLAEKIEKKTIEEIEAMLDPRPLNTALLLSGSPEEIATTLFLEGAKRALAKLREGGTGFVSEAAGAASATAYRRL
ncbi:hypothetical protein [Spirosoma linguale]|uniref:Uncharacterized protein n=1 Tax=Spirosoma linguale (strain ATCC 33905 / DSM 74 / LMG 10896 / Claus 1) TaxID=504472 RepID=D2QJR2_SPILD|nr:hypothetical protein Slin_4121 [Spirosoma linguale DSM 74]